ncbi:MAG: hypothetical protein M1823_003641 [Watsoniomyces obsoletus]|nr:MAG: hypothetical protein M1823_003641 [Watsoniomyces obsoletus]
MALHPVQAGDVLWLPAKKRLSADSMVFQEINTNRPKSSAFNHPVVVLDRHGDLVVIHTITSTISKANKGSYLPIEPSPAHAPFHVQLALVDGVKLDRLSYVRMDNHFVVDATSLQVFRPSAEKGDARGTSCIRLTKAARQILRRHSPYWTSPLACSFHPPIRPLVPPSSSRTAAASMPSDVPIKPKRVFLDLPLPDVDNGASSSEGPSTTGVRLGGLEHDSSSCTPPSAGPSTITVPPVTSRPDLNFGTFSSIRRSTAVNPPTAVRDDHRLLMPAPLAAARSLWSKDSNNDNEMVLEAVQFSWLTSVVRFLLGWILGGTRKSTREDLQGPDLV